MEKCELLSLFHLVPVDNTIAWLGVELPEPMHSDPADRIIIATTLSLGATLVTNDPKIFASPRVKTLRLASPGASADRGR